MSPYATVFHLYLTPVEVKAIEIICAAEDRKPADAIRRTLRERARQLESQSAKQEANHVDASA